MFVSRTAAERRPVKALALLFLGALAPATAPPATAQESLPSIAEKTRGTTPMEGFFNLYWDEGDGILYWELDLSAGEFLYQPAIFMN